MAAIAFYIPQMVPEAQDIMILYFQPVVPVVFMAWLWGFNVKRFEQQQIEYDLCFSTRDRKFLLPHEDVLEVGPWYATVHASNMLHASTCHVLVLLYSIAAVLHCPRSCNDCVAATCAVLPFFIPCRAFTSLASERTSLLRLWLLAPCADGAGRHFLLPFCCCSVRLGSSITVVHSHRVWASAAVRGHRRHYAAAAEPYTPCDSPVLCRYCAKDATALPGGVVGGLLAG